MCDWWLFIIVFRSVLYIYGCSIFAHPQLLLLGREGHLVNLSYVAWNLILQQLTSLIS